MKNFLNFEIQNLLSLTKDWAGWTEAWLYMRGQNPSFEKINIVETSWINNKINILAYLTLDGKIKAGGLYDGKK